MEKVKKRRRETMEKRKRKEYTFHSKEEKLSLVKRNLEGETCEALEKETGIDA